MDVKIMNDFRILKLVGKDFWFSFRFEDFKKKLKCENLKFFLKINFEDSSQKSL